MLKEDLENINKNTATLKNLFEEKQKLMTKMYEDGVLTKKVAKTWNASLADTQSHVNEIIQRNATIRKSLKSRK